MKRVIKKAGKQWKIEVDYPTRSLAERAMFRFKGIYGGNLSIQITEN